MSNLPSPSDDAFLNRWSISKELEGGGTWLGDGREYLKCHVRGGDEIIWGSGERLSLSGRDLEELMLKVAAAAVLEDRTKYAKERETERKANVKIADLLLKQDRANAISWAHGIVLRNTGRVEVHTDEELAALKPAA